MRPRWSGCGQGWSWTTGRRRRPQVRELAPGRIELRIHEGRNRQVRRMCEAVGHPVLRLHRSAYAGLTVEGLAPGRWRELEPAELDRLRSA